MEEWWCAMKLRYCSACCSMKDEDQFEFTFEGNRRRNCRACAKPRATTRACKVCHLPKPIEEFKRPRGKYRTFCQACGPRYMRPIPTIATSTPGEPMTEVEIGKALGITRQRVDQIIKHALDKLQRKAPWLKVYLEGL